MFHDLGLNNGVMIHISDLIMAIRLNANTFPSGKRDMDKLITHSSIYTRHTLDRIYLKYIYVINVLKQVCIMITMRYSNIMDPIICTHRRLHGSNGNKITSFLGSIWNNLHNAVVRSSQAHNHGKIWQKYERLMIDYPSLVGLLSSFRHKKRREIPILRKTDTDITFFYKRT